MAYVKATCTSFSTVSRSAPLLQVILACPFFASRANLLSRTAVEGALHGSSKVSPPLRHLSPCRVGWARGVGYVLFFRERRKRRGATAFDAKPRSPMRRRDVSNVGQPGSLSRPLRNLAHGRSSSPASDRLLGKRDLRGLVLCKRLGCLGRSFGRKLAIRRHIAVCSVLREGDRNSPRAVVNQHSAIAHQVQTLWQAILPRLPPASVNSARKRTTSPAASSFIAYCHDVATAAGC
jgi:hypothetical protein